MEYNFNDEYAVKESKNAKRINTLISLSFILIIPIVNIFYGILDNSRRGAFNLQTGIDRAIPFIKIFIIPYVIWYPYILLTLLFLCLNERRTYYKTLISLQLGLIFCYLIYFFFQTTVPRPQVSGSDILSKLILFVYRTDKPYNCFPSIHVLSCIILMRGALQNPKKNMTSTFVITVMSSLIIVSTLFVKQHVILDVVSAILLSNITFALINILERKFITMRASKTY